MKMRKNISKIIPAAICAAVLTTPAMACTDWKAVAAFDAIVWAEFQRDSDQAAECKKSSWKAWWSRNIQYLGEVCESEMDIINPAFPR